MLAILDHLLASLDSATARAVETNPVLVFESLLVSAVLIILLYVGLGHIYKMRRLESEDRKAVLKVVERMNRAGLDRVEPERAFKWLGEGGQK